MPFAIFLFIFAVFPRTIKILCLFCWWLSDCFCNKRSRRIYVDLDLLLMLCPINIKCDCWMLYLPLKIVRTYFPWLQVPEFVSRYSSLWFQRKKERLYSLTCYASWNLFGSSQNACEWNLLEAQGFLKDLLPSTVHFFHNCSNVPYF